jgi:nucleotide-binding universal stress UspA family protein
VINEYYAFDSGYLTKAMADVEKSSTLKLRALARQFSRRVPVRTVQVTGHAVATILAQAASTKAAYVVMGSHGHGAMFDLLVGSTTHGVLRQAPCPVLVVPMGPA